MPCSTSRFHFSSFWKKLPTDFTKPNDPNDPANETKISAVFPWHFPAPPWTAVLIQPRWFASKTRKGGGKGLRPQIRGWIRIGMNPLIFTTIQVIMKCEVVMKSERWFPKPQGSQDFRGWCRNKTHPYASIPHHSLRHWVSSVMARQSPRPIPAKSYWSSQKNLQIHHPVWLLLKRPFSFLVQKKQHLFSGLQFNLIKNQEFSDIPHIPNIP